MVLKIGRRFIGNIWIFPSEIIQFKSNHRRAIFWIYQETLNPFWMILSGPGGRVLLDFANLKTKLAMGADGIRIDHFSKIRYLSHRRFYIWPSCEPRPFDWFIHDRISF